MISKVTSDKDFPASFVSQLEECLSKRPVVFLGAGAQLRGDDAWTFGFISSLKRSVPADIYCLWGSTMPENFIAPAVRLAPKSVIICDTSDFGAPAGTVRFFSAGELADEAPVTHRMPLSLLASMIEDRAPCKCYLLFMQPQTIEFGTKLSPLIGKKSKNLVQLVLSLLKQR